MDAGRERERKRERKASERAQSSLLIAMRDDPNEERDGWIIRPEREFSVQKRSSSLQDFLFFVLATTRV